MSDGNSSPGAQTTPPIDASMMTGLTMLRQSWIYAEDSKEDLWDFALEIDVLYESGLTISDLRWLVCKGYVQHGEETSAYGDRHRSFKPSDGLNFANSTCFVLTQTGAAFAEKVTKQAAATN